MREPLAAEVDQRQMNTGVHDPISETSPSAPDFGPVSIGCSSGAIVRSALVILIPAASPGGRTSDRAWSDLSGQEWSQGAVAMVSTWRRSQLSELHRSTMARSPRLHPRPVI